MPGRRCARGVRASGRAGMARRSRPSYGRFRARARGRPWGRGWGRPPTRRGRIRATRPRHDHRLPASPRSPPRSAPAASSARSSSPATPATTRARAGWNGAIDRRPAAVAQRDRRRRRRRRGARGARRRLPCTIRGGGHSVAGRSVRDGALCLDLRALDAVDVDPARALVRVGGGALLSGARRGHAGARARGPGRADLAHRRRRAHARRRPRLAHAPARPHDRLAAARPTSSSPTASRCARAPTSIPTCSGRCAAAAGTSRS